MQDWLEGGCRGDRPEPDPEFLATERGLAAARQNDRIAGAGLPAHESVLHKARRHLDALQAEQRKILREAALAEVQRLADQELVPALGKPKVD